MTRERQGEGGHPNPQGQNIPGEPFEEQRRPEVPRSPAPSDDQTRQVEALAEDLEADEASSVRLDEGSGTRAAPG
jgi:hypothetical protein